jgi:hypothetical protein
MLDVKKAIAARVEVEVKLAESIALIHQVLKNLENKRDDASVAVFLKMLDDAAELTSDALNDLNELYPEKRHGRA